MSIKDNEEQFKHSANMQFGARNFMEDTGGPYGPAAQNHTRAGDDQAHRAAIRSFDTHAPLPEVTPVDPHIAHLIAIYNKVDARAQAEIFACATRQLHYLKDSK